MSGLSFHPLGAARTGRSNAALAEEQQKGVHVAVYIDVLYVEGNLNAFARDVLCGQGNLDALKIGENQVFDKGLQTASKISP